MNISKTIITRALLSRNFKKAADIAKQSKRNSAGGSWAYRVPPQPPSKKAVMIAEIGGTIAWCWIFYHLFTEPEHVYGEFKYIYPETYTDEELGIPPDEVGFLKKEEK